MVKSKEPDGEPMLGEAASKSASDETSCKISLSDVSIAERDAAAMISRATSFFCRRERTSEVLPDKRR